jgi:hypothetical protein
MNTQRNLIEQYRASRTGATDHRLSNTICVAADLILKIEGGYYPAEQSEDGWDMVEALIRRYAEGRRNEKGQ